MLADGLVVLEVTRPNRQERHRNGKDDDLDAIEAARAVIAGRALATAKTSTGNTEALRVLLGAQRSAKQARISAMVQLRHLMFTAPDELRERYAKLSRKELTAQCARLRPRLDGDGVRYATKTAALTLARRAQTLMAEIDDLDVLIAGLVKQIAPDLLNVYGVGTDVAAAILVAVGDNPERIRTEAAFAKLCGVAPLPANSGKRTGRHRLNPRREPPRQQRLVAHRAHQGLATRAAHRRLPRTTTSPGPVESRDLPLPQALRRPRSLHRPAAVS